MKQKHSMYASLCTVQAILAVVKVEEHHKGCTQFTATHILINRYLG